MSASSAASDPIHLLKENGADEAPFADFTLCGVRVTDATSAMWPGDTLAEYHIRGRWCPACKDAGRRVQPRLTLAELAERQR